MFTRHIVHWLNLSQISGLPQTAGDPGGGGSASATGTGAPAGGGTGSPSSPTTPEGGAAAAGSSAAASAPAGAASAGKTYSEAEYQKAIDTARRGWVPGDRLGVQSRKVTELELKLADATGRIAALAGLTPKTDAQIADDDLQAAFAAKFPHLGKLTPEMVGRLEKLLDSEGQLNETTRHHWDGLAQRTLRSLESQFLEQLGAEELKPSQRQKLNAAFLAWGNGTGPDDLAKFKQRYDAEDPTLLVEFLKEFREDFFIPVRRQVAEDATRRFRPVPSGGRSAAVVTQEPKPKPGNLDAAIDRAAKIINERGGFDAAQR